MNSFTVSVEKHARASVNVTKAKLISIAVFFVNVEVTFPKSKEVKC